MPHALTETLAAAVLEERTLSDVQHSAQCPLVSCSSVVVWFAMERCLSFVMPFVDNRSRISGLGSLWSWHAHGSLPQPQPGKKSVSFFPDTERQTDIGLNRFFP